MPGRARSLAAGTIGAFVALIFDARENAGSGLALVLLAAPVVAPFALGSILRERLQARVRVFGLGLAVAGATSLAMTVPDGRVRRASVTRLAACAQSEVARIGDIPRDGSELRRACAPHARQLFGLAQVDYRVATVCASGEDCAALMMSTGPMSWSTIYLPSGTVHDDSAWKHFH